MISVTYSGVSTCVGANLPSNFNVQELLSLNFLQHPGRDITEKITY